MRQITLYRDDVTRQMSEESTYYPELLRGSTDDGLIAFGSKIRIERYGVWYAIQLTEEFTPKLSPRVSETQVMERYMQLAHNMHLFYVPLPTDRPDSLQVSEQQRIYPTPVNKF